jgi:ornithine cyclodeaminase/alanine dehydrogenase-like protein (mu-crystallin family)
VSSERSGTLLLTKTDVAELLPMSECIEAVEKVFAMHARRETGPPAVLGVPLEGGGFHIKAAAADIDGSFFAVKINANFPANPTRFGLPTIQGILVLFDAVHGAPLAVMDSAEITAIRTAAATAVAAKYLARSGASTVTICGCGEQSRSQLRALTEVRSVARVFAYDKDSARAAQYAEFVRKDLRLDTRVVGNLREATHQSDITVTCTTARQHFLGVDDVSSGAFVAAVGADNPEKQEIDPELMASSTLVVDVLEQCAAIGDLHHAIDAGVMTKSDVHAELGEILAGLRPGRTSDDEVIVFDSTGTALQDVAAAALVYRKAVREGKARVIDFA